MIRKGASLVILALLLAHAALALEVAVRDADTILHELTVAAGPSPALPEIQQALRAGRTLSTGVTLTELSRAQMDLLRAQGYDVFEPVKIHATLAESVPQIHADEAQAVAFTAPVRGVGAACVIDTGVNYNHEMLGGGGFPNEKVIGGTDIYNNDDDPLDDNGHGSHTSSTIAGDGVLVGVAPGAKIVHVKALAADGTGELELLAEAIRWCTNHSEVYNISVISMSLGDGGTYTEATCPTDEQASYRSTEEALREADAAGLAIVASSGNEGSSLGIGYPACNPLVVSVGSVGDGTSNSAVNGCRGSYTLLDVISGFTNTHRTLDLLAPGACITAAGETGNSLADKGGTSMATPHVAGAMLLLEDLEAQLGITESRAERLQLLKDTGVMIARDGEAWPRIDVMAAFARLLPVHLSLPEHDYCTACTLEGALTNTENATGLNETNITLTVQSTQPAQLFVDGEEVNGTNNTFLIGGLPPLVTRNLTIIVNASAENITLIANSGGINTTNKTITEDLQLIAPAAGAYTRGRFTYRVESPVDSVHECSLYLNDTLVNTSTVVANTNHSDTTTLTGNVTWNVSCTREGVTGWSERRWTISDLTAPRISADLNQSLFRPNDTAALNITVLDDGLVVNVTTTTRLTRNGSLWNGTPVMNESGIPITAVDAAGNTAVLNLTNYTIDGDAPIVWNLTPERSRETNVTFAWLVNDTTATTCTHAVGNETPVPADRNRTVTLGEGNHTWVVNCTDAVGWSTREQSWTIVDLADPVIEDVALSDNIVQPNTLVDLSFSAADSLGLARVTVQGAVVTGEGSDNNRTYNVTLNESTTTTIPIEAVDKGGRSTTRYQTLIIDGDEPRITVVLENESNDSVVTSTPLFINWSINESHPENTTLFLDGGPVNSSNATAGREHTTPLPGPRTLVVTSEDAAGNTARTARNFTANTTINTTALIADLSAMLGEDVALLRDGAPLNEYDHLDGRITLTITRPRAQLSMVFDGLRARWGAPWSVGATTHDFTDDVLDSFALTLNDFIAADAVSLSAWFNTTNGTHVVALDGNKSVPLPPCPSSGGCYNRSHNRSRTNTTLLEAREQAVTGFVALRDGTPPSILSVTPAAASGTSPVTVTLTVQTGEDATCRYSRTAEDYAHMAGVFNGGSTTPATTHTTERSYTTTTTETLHIACQDAYENEARTDHVLTVTIETVSSNAGGGGGRGGGRGGGGRGGGGGAYFFRDWPREEDTNETRNATGGEDVGAPTIPAAESAAGAPRTTQASAAAPNTTPPNMTVHNATTQSDALVSSLPTPNALPAAPVRQGLTAAAIKETAPAKETFAPRLVLVALVALIGTLLHTRRKIVTSTRRK
ncbi:hypothetical protein D6789_02065 [Candidatus Woesearchaeota archaeon]|nr:MAG: hypothetical protein D6789_02065 [Candidatus Woesearchaeota archaeon]